MFNIVRYINDTDFQIIYINKQLNIANYQKINYMDNDKISISYNDGVIIVGGEDIRAKKLLDNEIIISGVFNSIEFRK